MFIWNVPVVFSYMKITIKSPEYGFRRKRKLIWLQRIHKGFKKLGEFGLRYFTVILRNRVGYHPISYEVRSAEEAVIR